MATTLKQTEAAPAAYPAAPGGLSDGALALDSATIWQRLEGYCGYRWSARTVIWTAEGPGAWFPPLAPATIATIERWEAGSWVEDSTLSASPMGGYCLQPATYRFTGTVGPATAAAPALVLEAYRRLVEHLALAKVNSQPGIRQQTIDGLMSTTYDAAALGRALDRSGAADCLRTLRRAA
ncbi:MAG TPA: hypothetical protein VIF40_20450 [Methylosinus sp.]|uniref:hypothetical protein n=1 Tax=Methylosinus sp. TaxID=427 RepID=UPI002F953D6B